MQSHLAEPVTIQHRGSGMPRHAAEHAHLDGARQGPAAHAEAALWQGGQADFLQQSHRVAERAACCLMGVTLTTLAMYNLALWLMR